MAFYSTDIPTISFISSSSVFLASNLLVRTGVSPTATSEIPTFRFQHQGHGSHESWEIRCLENLTKNDNGSQNDTARHRKITYRTVRNRTKMRKWQKNRDKVARKKCTKPYVGIRRIFVRFLEIFPPCLQVKMPQSTP